MNSLFWVNSRIEKFGQIMFDLRLLNVEKLLHQFIISMNAKIRPSPCKRLGKVQFISQVDKSLQVKKELKTMSEKMKDAAAQEHFDIADEKSVQHFIERKINFLDKHIHHSSTHPLTSNLRNMNKNIIQRVIRTKRCNLRDMRKPNLRLHHELPIKRGKESIPVAQDGHCITINMSEKPRQHKEKRYSLQTDSKTCSNNTFLKSHKGTRKNNSITMDRKKLHGPCNPISDLTKYTKQEIRNTTQFLALCVRDDEFKKRNELNRNNRINDVRREDILLLCQRAILCSIEPSEKAFVIFKNDLSAIIKNHLSQGYRHHFDHRSDCEGHYCALLILNRWAKLLVRDANTILICTIAGIINCSTDEILTLSCSQDK